MKVLNVLMLRLYSFIILGFGEIHTRGIERYVVIIEDFIGWFLLKLFRVSLITQLLQKSNDLFIYHSLSLIPTNTTSLIFL